MFKAAIKTSMAMMMGSMCMMPCFNMPCAMCFSVIRFDRAMRMCK